METMNLKIDNELRDLIPPLAEDEIKQLENNLLKEGWRDNERIITWNGTIVDGHNRYFVCSKHNIPFKTQEQQFKDKNAVILWMIDNQLGRRNIPDYARVELNLRKEDILKPIAKQQQATHTEQGYQKSDKAIHINKEIAKIAKVSHDTVAKVKFIRDNADEETKTKLRSGNKELSINKVYTDLKKKEQREKVIEQFKDAPKLEAINKKYKIIYADPPWKYFAGGNKNQSQYYQGMTIEEIKKLPVEKLADEDCILFLWVTFPILKEAFEVIEAWGFEYSTCGFNWIKKNKSGEGWFFGLGNWTRSNSELCLIAKRGSPIRQSASVSQVIDAPIQEHSRKPDIVRDKIIELVGDLPRIELFARQTPKGWDVWGNEVDKT
jgi:N6-adenosine-specific RNA methylase IME4